VIPKFKLPENCRHIYSEVKSAQCVQIGAIESKGNYIMNFADDCTLTPGSLDVLLAAAKKCFDQQLGFDKNFFAIYYDADFAFRVRSNGGKTVICSDAWICETKPKGIPRLSSLYGPIDGKLWMSAWCRDINLPKVLDKRNFLFEPYDVSDINILKTIN